MISASLNDAFAALTSALTSQPALDPVLRRHWREELSDHDDTPLPPAFASAADVLSAELPELSWSEDPEAVFVALLVTHGPEVLMSWCAANAWRNDTCMSGILMAAAGEADLRAAIAGAARERVVSGPLVDALACVPLTGDGRALFDPDNAEVRARLEILIWEAGNCAWALPDFGEWIWSSPAAFDTLIETPSHGALRGRVLAARCLESTVGAITPMTDPQLVGRTLSVLQPLLLHPEPLVWVHAARALGRLTGAMEELQGMLLDWVMGESPVLRQRAMTAFASLPAERLGFLASQLIAIVRSKDEDPSVLAAIAAATPYLYFERPDIWDVLAGRIYAGDGGAITARALARGLATLWRRGTHNEEIEPHLRRLPDARAPRADGRPLQHAPLARGDRRHRRRGRRGARPARPRAGPRQPRTPRGGVRRPGGGRSRRPLRRVDRERLRRVAPARHGGEAAASARGGDERGRGVRARVRPAHLGAAPRHQPGRPPRGGAGPRGDLEGHRGDARSDPRPREAAPARRGRRDGDRRAARGARAAARGVRAGRLRRG